MWGNLIIGSVGFVVGGCFMLLTTYKYHLMLMHELSESLTHVRQVMARGDVNMAMLMLQRIDDMMKSWRQRPRVRDE